MKRADLVSALHGIVIDGALPFAQLRAVLAAADEVDRSRASNAAIIADTLRERPRIRTRAALRDALAPCLSLMMRVPSDDELDGMLGGRG